MPLLPFRTEMVLLPAVWASTKTEIILTGCKVEKFIQAVPVKLAPAPMEGLVAPTYWAAFNSIFLSRKVSGTVLAIHWFNPNKESELVYQCNVPVPVPVSSMLSLGHKYT